MKRGLDVLAITSALFALRLVLPLPAPLHAEPLAQATAIPTIRPTDEPTKPPYVFPTPIFIPTFQADTPAPAATRAPTGTPIAPIAGSTTYTVEAGDSLWTISRKVYSDPTKYQLILQANNLTDSTRLRVGQVLMIPPLTPVATATSLPLPTATPSLAPSPTALLAITPTRVPTPASSSVDAVKVVLIVVGVILAGGLIALLVLVFLAYRRRLQVAMPGVRPITARASFPPPLAPPEHLN